MITNNNITIYHKIYNKETRLNEWIRINCDDVWLYVNNGSNIKKGYEKNDKVSIRIPYKVSDIQIGDIIVVGHLLNNIETQEQLKNYEVYNITSITNNNFGNNPHIHIGAK